MPGKPPDAFLSYTRFDDRRGDISKFREWLSDAVQEITGEPFEIFQDVEGIGLGEHWPGRLDEMLEETRFFIPILTPSFFRSQACRDELEKFLKAEKTRGRKDLILPIYYIRCPRLEDPSLRTSDPLAVEIHERQREDWRERRFKPFEDPEVRRSLEALAYKIDDARRRQEERERAEAKRRARKEETRQQAEEQARTPSAGEQSRRAAEAEAKRRAEQDERKRAEQEATRRDAAERERIQAEEAESKRQAEREARERASGASSAPDVFLAYARDDQARACELATALEQRGLSVSWDRKTPPGRSWRDYIGETLDNARCVVVAWSSHSVNSAWVIEEADSGLRRRILVPVLFEAVAPPLGFGSIRTASLVDWSPGHSSPEFDDLFGEVQQIVGAGAGRS